MGTPAQETGKTAVARSILFTIQTPHVHLRCIPSREGGVRVEARAERKWQLLAVLPTAAEAWVKCVRIAAKTLGVPST